MSHGAPLITQRIDSGTWTKLPQVDAHYSYVLAYKRGELRSFTHTPGLSDRAGSTRCYIVDMARRSLSGELLLAAKGGRYKFVATYQAQWQIADPVEVVRGNVEDGADTVTAYLATSLQPIGRRFDPADDAGVESEIAGTIGAEAMAGGVLIGAGLALTALAVRFNSDPRVIGRDVEVDDDAHQGKLDKLQMIRLRDLLNGDGSAISLHLVRNPNDTATVLQMIREAKDKSEQLRLEWLDRMWRDDAIQAADYDEARAAVLGGASAQAPMAGPGAVGWSGPADPFAPPPAPPPPGVIDLTSTEPLAPREVHVRRTAHGAVVVSWSDVGDVEYRVRCLAGDGRWRVVGRTRSTEIEDGGALPGALPVYAVSASASGERSAEVRSG